MTTKMLRLSLPGALGLAEIAALKAFVARLEALQAEIDASSADKAELYKEIKAKGFDKRAVRAVLRRLAEDAGAKNKRERAEDLVDLYLAALDPPAATGASEAAENRSRFLDLPPELRCA